jgi:hypothetical protein
MSNDYADTLMENFDRWNDDDKRKRFINRMQHKLYAKEHRISRNSHR